ncbi:MAG: hypothetical protein K2G63_03400 [Oscillospiraceae bacterium]|nr:hypothetical protein [Oscillospiraceae bacterium]
MSLKSLSVKIGADTSEFSQGMRSVSDGIRSTQETAEKASKSLASQAASLAAEYKKQGMNASEAFRNAWNDIERTSPKSDGLTSKSSSFGLKSFFSGFASSAKSAKNETESINSSVFKSQNLIEGVSSGMKSLTSVAKKLGTAIVAAFSIRAIVSFSKECKSLYEIQLEAETKLETILRDHLDANDDLIQSVKDYASEIQNLGVIGDEVQLSGIQELATYVENAENLKIMMPVLTDMLAQQYGLNATAEESVTIATMLGKVLSGQTSALSRYGYYFDDVQEQLLKFGTEEQKVATLAEVISDSVGGINEALAKTNAGRMKQLSNTIGDIKEQFGSAVTQIQVIFLPLLKKIADMLTNIATIAERLSQSLANVFSTSGSAYISTLGIADSASLAAESYEDMAESAEDAEKANERSLAGFDAINTISGQNDIEDETSSKTNTSTVSSKNPNTVDTENIGENLEKIKHKFQPVINSISELWEALNPLKKIALDGLMNFYRDFLLPVGNWVLGKGLPDLIDVFTEGISSIDWDNINDKFDGLWKALSPFAVTCGEGLLWFWEEVLVPLGSWSFNNLLPTALDILSSTITILNSVVNGFKPFGKWLWDKFIKPISEWTGKIVTSGLEKFAEALENVAKWCNKNKSSAGIIFALSGAVFALNSATKAEAISKFVGKLVSGIKSLRTIDVTVGVIIAGIAGWVYAITEVVKNWDDIFSVIKEDGGILNFISNWIDSLRSEIEEFFKFSWFGEKWYNFWSKAGKLLYDCGGNIVHGLLQGIVNAFSAIGNWIGENIFYPFINAFKKLFGIHSPSTVMAELGVYIIEGLCNAISGRIAKVKEIFEEILEKIKNVFLNIDDWFSEKFKSARNNIINIFSNIGKWFSNRRNDITSTFSSADKWFKDKFQKAYDNITYIFKNIGKWFANRWNDIKTALSDAGEWFGEVFQNAWDNITGIFKSIGNWFFDRRNDINNVFSDIGDWFKDKFQNARNNITDIFKDIGEWFLYKWNDITFVLSNVSDWFKNKFQSARDNITGIFNDVGQWFSNRWNDITSIFNGVGDWFSEKFQSAYDNITGIFSGIGGWFSGIWEDVSEGAKEGVNWVIGKINGMINKLNCFSFELPGVLGGGTIGFDIPEVPYLAKGGIVNSPTLAMIGEAGKEAVIPLQNNTEWISDISSGLWGLLKNALPEYNNQKLNINLVNNTPKLPKIQQPVSNSHMYNNYKYETYNIQRNLYTNQNGNNKQNDNFPPVNIYLYPNSKSFKRDVLNAYREEIARGGKI